VRRQLNRRGLLYVADCKMAALQTRARLVHGGDQYLTPLPLTGETAQQIEAWIDRIVEGEQTATLIWQADELIGAGYEFERPMTATLAKPERAPKSEHGAVATDESTVTVTWTERVLVLRSTHQAQAQGQTLRRQVSKAKAALDKLAPAPARGKRPIRDEALLQQRIQAILDEHAVQGLLAITYERQEPEAGQPYYRITAIQENESAIGQRAQRLGWRAMVCNAPADQLALAPLALIYRQGWGLERLFHHLKSAPLGLAPLWVRLDHQIRGLTHLLTLGLRVLSTLEWALRDGLAHAQQQLSGLYPGNPNRRTAHPTALMVLKAFVRVEPTLTLIRTPAGLQRHFPSLPPSLRRVLRCLGLPLTLYHRLQLP